jgi:predicted patatin/cPLA2 family phospholipase
MSIGTMAQTHWHLIERLIVQIEKHPSIYDKSLSEYKDVDKKEKSGKKLQENFQLVVSSFASYVWAYLAIHLMKKKSSL